jgi:hypothetical protein
MSKAPSYANHDPRNTSTTSVSVKSVLPIETALTTTTFFSRAHARVRPSSMYNFNTNRKKPVDPSAKQQLQPDIRQRSVLKFYPTRYQQPQQPFQSQESITQSGVGLGVTKESRACPRCAELWSKHKERQFRTCIRKCIVCKKNAHKGLVSGPFLFFT